MELSHPGANGGINNNRYLYNIPTYISYKVATLYYSNKNENIHENEVQDIKRNWTFVVQLVILGKVQYLIWNPHRIFGSKKKKNI